MIKDRTTCTGPYFNYSTVFCHEVHVHFMDHFFSDQQSSSMKYSQGCLLIQFQVILLFDDFFILRSQLFLTDDVADIMLDLLNLSLFQLDRNVGLISFFEVFDLNQLCHVIYDLFQRIGDFVL